MKSYSKSLFPYLELYKDISGLVREGKFGRQDNDFEDFYDDDDIPCFEPCRLCDGHPACEDFGWAIKSGNANLVQITDENFNEWL